MISGRTARSSLRKYIFDVQTYSDNIRTVFDKVIGGVDICYVDPLLFPKLLSWIENHKDRYKDQYNKTVLDKLNFIENYIRRQERRDEIRLLLTHKTEKRERKKPVMTREQVDAEVNSIMENGINYEYTEEQVNLIVPGLRRKRAELVKDGDYLEANRANNYVKIMISHEQFSTVEAMQQEKCEMLQTKIDEESEKLKEKKKRWIKVTNNLRKSADKELREMKVRFNKEIEDLNSQKNKVPITFQKFSAGLLNLRRRKEAMMQTRRYGEAGQYQEIADKMEEDEIISLEKRWADNIDSRIRNLQASHRRQLEGRSAYWRHAEKKLMKERRRKLKLLQAIEKERQKEELKLEEYKARFLERENRKKMRETARASRRENVKSE